MRLEIPVGQNHVRPQPKLAAQHLEISRQTLLKNHEKHIRPPRPQPRTAATAAARSASSSASSAKANRFGVGNRSKASRSSGDQGRW